MMMLADVIGAFEEAGDPADAALGQGELQLGIAAEGLGPEKIRRAVHDADRRDGDHHVDRSIHRGELHSGCRADVNADHGAFV